MLLARVAQRVFTLKSCGYSCCLRAALREEGCPIGRLSSRRLQLPHPCNFLEAAPLRSFDSMKGIHTTRPRSVNPVLLAIIRPVSKALAVLVGRGFRKWWQALPKHKKQIFIDHLRRNRVRYAIGGGVVGSVAFLYYNNHVTVAPYTGRKRFMLLTSNQLFSMSKQIYEMEMEQFGHLMVDEHHPIVERVRRVGNRILQANYTLPELYTKSWTVSVVDDSMMNCFVLPTGDIVMFTGMMEVLDNDDQVAAVLAHEMSHAILDHAAEHINRGYLLDLMILVPVTLIWAVLPSDLLAMASHWLLNLVVKLFLTLPYSRILESEADYLGLQLAAKACFDVREFSALWGKIAILEKIKEKSGNANDGPGWLSTHPTNEDRQRELEEKMGEALNIRKSCKCPPLSLRDPRELIRSLKAMVDQPSKQTLPMDNPIQKPVSPASLETVKIPVSS